MNSLGSLRSGVVSMLAALLCAFPACLCTAADTFRSDVALAPAPWSHLRFLDDGEAFRFVIMSDRAGAIRAGVFERAVGKVNLLRPEFVLTVGDLIEGRTTDLAVIDAQWREFHGFIGRMEPPFFFLPGNHDIANPVMAREWEARFGRRHYSFVYKNTLFLCLDSQDGPGARAGLGEAQLAWVGETLARHRDVRWTFVLLHQPLWLYEENDARKVARLSSDEWRAQSEARRRELIDAAKSPLGFSRLEEMLAGRPHDIFAGHFHTYLQYSGARKNYHNLATTGGGSALRGPEFGEFDHVLWVSMEKDGPRFTNLLLDGIQPADVFTEAHRDFREQRAQLRAENGLEGDISVSLSLRNPFPEELGGRLLWTPAPDWRIEPDWSEIAIPAGGRVEVKFALRYLGTDTHPELPSIAGAFHAGEEDIGLVPYPLRWDLGARLARHRPRVEASRTPSPPALDGVLDDAAWRAATCIEGFRTRDGMRRPTVATTAWIAYDDEALYVAFRCEEPDTLRLRRPIEAPDSGVWLEDSVEVFVDPEFTHERSFQFAINRGGTLYDAVSSKNGYEDAYASRVRRACRTGAREWIAELAIPWTDLGLDAAPPPGSRLAFALVRNRPLAREHFQFPPLNGDNHQRRLHAELFIR